MGPMKVTLLVIAVGVTLCLAQPNHSSSSRWQFPIPEFQENFSLRTGRIQNQQLSSDTSGFTLLGTWKWGESHAVAVRDTLLYMGNGSLLQVYSIADTSAPRFLGEVDLPSGGIQAIVLKDSMAYVAAGYVQAVNIGDPRAPRLVDTVDLFATPTRIAVVDSFLYVVTFSGTFWVVDISEPSTLVRRGSCLTHGEQAHSVAARGRYAYGAGTDFPAFSIFDARNPDAPVRMFFQYGGVFAAVVVDTFLYIAGWDEQSQGQNGIIVYSISQPSTPRRLAQLNTSLRSSPALAICDTMLYYSEADSVRAISVADPSNPRMLHGVRNARPNIFGANEISAHIDNFVAAQGRGVWGLSTAPQNSLRERWFLPTGGAAVGIALKRNFAFVSSFLAGLWMLNIANLGSILPVANTTPSGGTEDIVLTDSLACTVQSDWGGKGVTIFNVTDPHNPILVGHYIGIDDYPYGGPAPPKLAYSNNILCVTKPGILNQDTILAELVDMSDPANPVQAGIVYGPVYEYVRSALARDTLLLLATNSNFRIFSIADPSRPALLSGLPGSYSGIEVQGPYLYTTTTSSFRVVDITVPSNPILIGTLAIAGSPSLSYSNGFVFGGGNTMYSIDVRNPCTPQLSQTYGPLPAFSDIVARNDTLFIAVAYGGIRVLKHRVPVAVEEDKPTRVPSAEYLSSNYPNPFNSQTTVEFALRSDQLITMKLFDILGREVRELFQGKVTRGHHTLTIDAASLASGVYFYHLLTESGERLSKPMVLVK